MIRIVLIGCVATKLGTSARAKDLYTSPLFRARRRYAEAANAPWYVLSAKHGIISPNRVIEPYNHRIPTTRAASEKWAVKSMGMLHQILKRKHIDPTKHPVTLEIHAGIDYVEPLRGFIRRRKEADLGHLEFIEVTHPVVGLGIGEQLHFYSGFTTNPR